MKVVVRALTCVLVKPPNWVVESEPTVVVVIALICVVARPLSAVLVKPVNCDVVSAPNSVVSAL